MLLICNIKFSFVFRHETYFRSQANIILLFIMYISPMETLKFNDFDIGITLRGLFSNSI